MRLGLPSAVRANYNSFGEFPGQCALELRTNIVYNMVNVE